MTLGEYIESAFKGIIGLFAGIASIIIISTMYALPYVLVVAIVALLASFK